MFFINTSPTHPPCNYPQLTAIMEDGEASDHGLVLTVITRGVRRDRHSPAQDRHSLPVPHPTSEHAQLLSNRPISVANPLSVPKEDLDLPPIDLSSIDLSEVQVIKVGFLSKTTQWQGDGASKRGEITQKRRFRLTEDAFEYFQHFSWNEKVKRSFPLTSVEKVEYDEVNNPTRFVLAFSDCTEVLHAETAEEASDWVDKITEACEEWNSTGEGVEPRPDEAPTADPSQLERDRSTKRSFVKQKPVSVISKRSRDTSFLREYHMIKYPQHLFRLPNEKVFKMDTQNMQIIWKDKQRSRFHQSKSLSLHRVVEVREGQQTEMFDKFPYEQVKEQSFSLLYVKEDKRYTYLTSLNLICDHPQNYDIWINELKSKVEERQHSGGDHLVSDQEIDTTDTTILWLKQMWSCESVVKNELSHKEALNLARGINPFISQQAVNKIVTASHFHQIESSYGLSLTLDGFVLMFNLLTNITDSRLYSIYKEYARESPQLGLTLDEFREFLVNECCWQRQKCSDTVLQRLMHSHDSYNHAYKKYIARNKSAHYVASRKLLSYVGFVSFLRSKDNPAIDPEHETVYQDMTQPLSHYFINSSHNTYLEGDQLSGKSSTEAYVRALLEGCRCVEIDCWDDTLNVTNLEPKEPIVYHGYTLTTKLPFREVVHTIKDYCFVSSNYPVIVSIENHCNKAHQTRMAKIFRAIFDEMLPKEDLVELEGRERLPSPQELQGKIILKGSYKVKRARNTRFPTRMRWMENHPTAAICPIDISPPTGQTFLDPYLPEESNKASSTSLIETASRASEEPESPTTVDSPSSSNGEESCFRFPADSPSSEQLPPFRSRAYSSKKIQKKLLEAEKDIDDQELAFKEMVGDLKALIIYAKATSIKPWSWRKQRDTTVTQMFSLGEPKAVELCTKSSTDMLACTERQLVRTYPKGTRFYSSNYDPLVMWRCGVQMVALNYQYPDACMHLNQGFFRLNGGCGYILKPAVMRREDPGGGATPFDPEMQTPHPDIPPIDLEIELLSGQRLCPWKKKCSSVSVVIHTYGIAHDCTHTKEAIHDSVLWPHWEKGSCCLKKSLYMPELCLVYFRVEADKKLFGQNCIPVISLQPGLKFIPLRTPGGELILESGLFVQIKKISTTTQSDGTLRLHHYDDDSQPLSISTTQEQPENVAEETSLNDGNQLNTCDAEVYEKQFTNIDD